MTMPALVCLLMPLGAVAQQTLTLEDCHRMAVENSKTLSQARTQVEMAGYDRKIALANYFPNLSVSGTYQYNNRDLALVSDAQSAALTSMGSTAQAALDGAFAAAGAQLGAAAQGAMTQLQTAIATNPALAAEYMGSPMWQTVLGMLQQMDLSGLQTPGIADPINAIGAQIYFCNIVLGNPMFMSVLMTAGQFPGLIILFAMPYISKRWSKQMFLLIGSVLLIVGFAITGLAGTNTTMIVVGTVIRSLGAGPLLSAVFALVPDVVEYGNWKFGIRSEGLISSAQSIGSKVGIGLGSALTGWILASVGYSGAPDAPISDAVVNAVKFDYTWLGAIIGVAIFVIVLLLNVEKYAPQYSQNHQ